MKPAAQFKFFDQRPAADLFVQEQRQAKLEPYVASLARMAELIDFVAIAAAVDAACPRPERRKGGRAPYPTAVMVRIVFLQALYNLSDEDCEYQLLDRASFQRFCLLDGQLHIPDARTLWLFKQRLAQSEMGGQAIFDAVSRQMQAKGYIPRGGQIVDASIVSAPNTHVKHEERQCINQGGTPEGWSAKRVRHTDFDARWTKKHGKSFYGYKVHTNTDARYKLIRQIKVTAAHADDGQTLKDVLDASNTAMPLYADRGDDSAANRQLLRDQGSRDAIARKAKPGQTATVRLAARNQRINKTRAPVEHIFASLHLMGGKAIRAMTHARNALAITIKCAVYNARRLMWLLEHDPA